MSRLRIQKTIKQYIGGKFVRSESGRTLPATSSRGEAMHVCQGSRKDLRNTVRIARTAAGSWGARSGFDRALYHAGWCDKVSALLSTVNPVQQAFVNYSMVRPLGIVFYAPDPKDGLLGMVDAVCNALVMGNSLILVVPVERAELGLALAEALHTSDVPGGVVNILTGDVAALVGVANIMEDLDAIVCAAGLLSKEDALAVETQAASVLRRIWWRGPATKPATPHELQKLAEIKTVWMSSGADITGGASY
jgi:acyl-CoA reductase-like NAD-dependent aldehyde dehydrogenase